MEWRQPFEEQSPIPNLEGLHTKSSINNNNKKSSEVNITWVNERRAKFYNTNSGKLTGLAFQSTLGQKEMSSWKKCPYQRLTETSPLQLHEILGAYHSNSGKNSQFRSNKIKQKSHCLLVLSKEKAVLTTSHCWQGLCLWRSACSESQTDIHV